METTKIPESGAAAKPGEGTAQAPSPAVNGEAKNLMPENVVALLKSDFAQSGPTDGQTAGEEVQPGGEARKIDVQPKVTPKVDQWKEPEWSADQQAWFELRAKATTAEEIAAADEQAPEFTAEQRAYLEKTEAGSEKSETGQLPEHLEAELAQWEERGGELPVPLQKLVEKRINKIVGEREQHKQRAERGGSRKCPAQKRTPAACPGRHPRRRG